MQSMLVFYLPECLLHNPPHEILSGRAVPYIESPERVARILLALKTDRFSVVRPDSDLDVLHDLKRVHTEDYIAHIRDVYKLWVSEGGDKVRCFCRLVYYVESHAVWCYP